MSDKRLDTMKPRRWQIYLYPDGRRSMALSHVPDTIPITVVPELTEFERMIVHFTMRRWGAHPIALYLQDYFSEPSWTIDAVKREQKRLVEMFRPS